MTRCAQFYEKCEREGYEWCGKSDQTERFIDYYIKIAKELEVFGIARETTYVGLSENAARPMFSVKEDYVRNTVLGNIAGMIKRGSPVSAKDIKLWIDLAEGKDASVKQDPKKPTPAPGVTQSDEERANEHAAKMAEKFPPVEQVQPVSTTQTSGPVNLTVKTPPNVSRIPPVFKDQYDVVIKRGLQVGVSERMAEGYATDLDDAVLKALDFWVNNIRDYTEATAL
jgi:hypothetical protein